MSGTSNKLSINIANEKSVLMQEMQFLGQMASTETALFHHAAAAKHNLGITDSKTISTLMQEGPMSAGELAKRLSLTTGAVTSVIDRIEKLGLVHRTADSRDRRKVIVNVNAKKLQKIGKVYSSMGETFQRQLEKYTTRELKFLVAYYKESIDLTKAEIAKLSK